MHPYIAYIVRSIVISGIGYCYYHIFLRNKKLHIFNRFYLLLFIGLSISIPLLHFSWYQTGLSTQPAIKILQAVSGGDEDMESYMPASPGWDIEDILWCCYYGTALLLLAIPAKRIITLFSIRHNSSVTVCNNVNIVHTQLPEAPFSLFNTIYWNEAIDQGSPNGQRIMKHELMHITQRHTLDKLFSTIAIAFFWMNPFYWLMQKELSLVHEFIADEEATDNNDTALFAEMLLQSHLGASFPSVIQPFFYSPIKRRLMMLKQTRQTNYAGLRKLLVLPLIAGTTLLFSFSIKEHAIFKPTHKTTIIADAGHGGDDMGGENTDGIKEKDLNLRICRELQRLAPEYDIDVVQTRKGDKTLNSKTRIERQAGTGAKLFLSIHIDKDLPATQTSNGYEVIVSAGNAKYEESKRLGSALVATLADAKVSPKLVERGVLVLKGNPLPAVLIECGSIDNKANVARLENDKELEAICRSILAGIARY